MLGERKLPQVQLVQSNVLALMMALTVKIWLVVNTFAALSRTVSVALWDPVIVNVAVTVDPDPAAAPLQE